MNERIFNEMAENLQKAINNDIAYIYSAFIPKDAENVLTAMKSDIYMSDRDFLDRDLQARIGNRWACPYDLLMQKLKTQIHNFYAEFTLSAQTLEKLSRYGNRAAVFKKQFQENVEKSKNTTINVMQREMDLQIMQNQDVKSVMRHMRQILSLRIQSLKQLLEASAGQMEQYMVLWNYQDMGFDRYRLVTVHDNCESCTALGGRIFPISEAESGKNFAPLHPNCDCRTEVLDKTGNVVCSIGKEEDKHASDQTHWYDAFIRIPKDAKALLDNLIQAQTERFKNISNPLDFLDWLTYGALSANQSRGQVALQDPTLYNIANWLSSGTLDMIKGTLQPEEPLSLQHWLDSLGTASLVTAAYNTATAAKVDSLPPNSIKYADDVVTKKTTVVDGTSTVDDFIKNNVNPSFQQNVKEAFMSDARVTVLEENLTVYRYHGGSSLGNSYWYTPNQTLNPAADLALPKGNTHQYIDTFIVPKGTTILEGTVAPNFGQPGGGYQFYIPDPSILIKQ